MHLTMKYMYSPGFLFVVLLAIVALPHQCSAAKILLIVGNMNSHVLYFSRIGIDLSRLGHTVLLVAPSNSRRPDCLSEAASSNLSFAYRTYPVDGNVPYVNSRATSERLIQLALTTSALEKFSLLYDFGKEALANWEADCRRLWANEETMTAIRTGGYDFAIMDPLAIHCYYVIPYSLGIKFATLSISSFAWAYRVPRLPSFVSSIGYTDRMSFRERLETLSVEMMQMAVVNSSTFYVTKFASDRPPLDMIGLLQNASLWFFMEDLSTGYALPLMPNTVSVGDIMAGQPGRPLSGDLERFLGDGKDAVVLVSFGSFFDFVPETVASKFCEAFRRMRSGLRVVWKLKDADKLCTGVDRLLTLPWIPQNDLLADPRVRLFVSHGGLNSIVESVYHAKPLIVFPVALDQPANAAAAQHKGFAVRMNFLDFDVDEFLSNVDRILQVPSFTSNAELASRIMRDKPDTPAQRMSRMIEHVIKYGDQHLRTGAFELNALQFMMFDLFVAYCVAAAAILVFIVLFTYCCVWRKCIRRCIGRKRKDGKQKSE